MNLTLLLEIEGGILLLAILFFVIYEVSVRHPNAFKFPKLSLPSLPTPKQGSFLDKLKQDAILIWKPTEPEFFVSPDGNTLYLSLKYTDNWLPYQVVLYMLSQKKEFLDQVKAKDPTVFDAINALVNKLEKSQVVVSFQKMNYLPTFQKNLLVWKLPLTTIPQPDKPFVDILVKELPIMQS